MRHIGVLRTIYKVSDFISWQKAGTLFLTPSFQRRNIWKPGAKSYLIDTIVRGLPIPIIFLRDRLSDIAQLEPKREVVDGQQRLRTLISFIAPNLLSDYRPDRDGFVIRKVHNKELANKRFGDLGRGVQQQILDYEFSVHVLSAGVDDREVLEIFARLNATGTKLNSQELRNAEYFGEFKTSMYSLANSQLPRWRTWKVFAEEDISRMKEVELTSEFVLLMLNGRLSGRNDATIKRFYENRDDEFAERAEVERRFNIVMDTIDDRLGANLHNLPIRGVRIFYSLFAMFYEFRFGIGSDLTRKKPRPVSNGVTLRLLEIADNITKQNVPEPVRAVLASRTTNLESRSALYDYLLKETADAPSLKSA